MITINQSSNKALCSGIKKFQRRQRCFHLQLFDNSTIIQKLLINSLIMSYLKKNALRTCHTLLPPPHSANLTIHPRLSLFFYLFYLSTCLSRQKPVGCKIETHMTRKMIKGVYPPQSRRYATHCLITITTEKPSSYPREVDAIFCSLNAK